MTCNHCHTEQTLLESFAFCEACGRPLDFTSQEDFEKLSLDQYQAKQNATMTKLSVQYDDDEKLKANSSAASWNTMGNTRKRWAGPLAAKPKGWVNPGETQTRTFVKSEKAPDYVVLNEVTEVVKFEAINLVDELLVQNSPQKQEQLEKIKKHKHVIFADNPTIFEFSPRNLQAAAQS